MSILPSLPSPDCIDVYYTVDRRRGDPRGPYVTVWRTRFIHIFGPSRFSILNSSHSAASHRRTVCLESASSFPSSLVFVFVPTLRRSFAHLLPSSLFVHHRRRANVTHALVTLVTFNNRGILLAERLSTLGTHIPSATSYLHFMIRCNANETKC